MKVSGLIAASFTVAALACPPPMNNWAFDANATHKTSDLIKAAMAEEGVTGWTEAVKRYHNKEEPWPASGGVSTIWYCYETEKDKRDLLHWFGVGISMWKNKLGPPGGATGHSLNIREVPIPTGETMNPYCKINGQWNNKVKSGTLVIRQDPDGEHGGSTRSSLGYTPAGDNDRNAMIVNLHKIPPGYEGSTIAHEFGHAIGLYHEHQRMDRDEFLSFRCEAHRDYDRARREILADGYDDAYVRWVCNDPNAGYKWDWLIVWWSKYDYTYDDGTYRRLGIGPFDTQSIMIYHSGSGADRSSEPHNINNYVLTRWRNPKANNQQRTWENSETFYPIQHVSDRDIEGVKAIYPFRP